MFSLQLFLLVKGYSPINYSTYKSYNCVSSSNHHSRRQNKVLKVYKDNHFKYLYITPIHTNWWSIFTESNFNTSGQYITICYPGEIIVSPTKTAINLNRYRHKLFDINKNKNIIFSFADLPANTQYSFYENENSYIVDIYSTSAYIYNIEINNFSNVNP